MASGLLLNDAPGFVGLGQGLNNFAAGVQQNKDRALRQQQINQQQQAMDQQNALATQRLSLESRKEQGEELNQGLIYDDDSQSFTKTPAREASDNAAIFKAQQDVQKLDPESKYNAAYKQGAINLINKVFPQYSNQSKTGSVTAPQTPDQQVAPGLVSQQPIGTPPVPSQYPDVQNAIDQIGQSRNPQSTPGMLGGSGGGLISPSSVPASKTDVQNNDLFEGANTAKDVDDRMTQFLTLAKTQSQIKAQEIAQKYQQMRMTLDQARMDETARHNAAQEGTSTVMANSRATMAQNAVNANASQVGHAYDNDPVLTPLRRNKNSLDRAMQTLQGSSTLLPQDFAAAQNEVVNALKNSGNSTNMQLDNELKKNAGLGLQEIFTRLGATEDIRKDPQSQRLIQQVLGVGNQISGDMQSQINTEADRIHANNLATTSPQAQLINKQKLYQIAPQAYQTRYGNSPPPLGQGIGSKQTKPSGLLNSPSSLSVVPGSPKVGTVVKGYKFIGGDPSNQSSWSKQ